MKHLKWPFILVFGLLAIFLLIQRFEPQPDRLEIKGQELGKPQDLPDFALTDAEGQVFDKNSFKKKWSVVFFGFTRCTTTCPMVMGYFKNEIARLDANDLQRLQFLMVSVDPEHDQPNKLKDFVKLYHAEIRGLSGTVDQVKSFAAGFHVGFAKEQQDPKNIDIYMMAHSPKIFLVDPNGLWRAVYDPPLAPGLLAADLQKVLSRTQEADQLSLNPSEHPEGSRG